MHFVTLLPPVNKIMLNACYIHSPTHFLLAYKSPPQKKTLLDIFLGSILYSKVEVVFLLQSFEISSY